MSHYHPLIASRFSHIIIHETARRVMTYRNRIEIDLLICSGKPVIKGTRILVSEILSQISAGESFESLKKGFPGITEEDIRAALAFAAATVNNVEIEELM